MALSQIFGGYFEDASLSQTPDVTWSENQTGLFSVGKSLRQNCGTGDVGRFQPSNTSFGRYCFAFKCATAPAANSEPFASDISINQWELRWNSSNKIDLYQTTTLKASGTTTFSVGTAYWFHVQLIDQASNNVILKYWDGSAWQTEITGTVGWAGRSHSTGFYFGKWANRNSQAVDYYFGHFAYDAAADAPRGYVVPSLPQSQSGSSSFTNGAGTLPTNIQPPRDSDTTYRVTSAFMPDTEFYVPQACSNLGLGASDTINGVKICCDAVRDGGTNGTIRTVGRSSAVDSNSANTSTGASYNPTANHVMATDPFTGAAWTQSGYDNHIFGVDEQDMANKSRVTSCYELVHYTPAAAAVASWVVGGGIIGTGSAG